MIQAETTSSKEHPLVLFDGVCNLCNATVNFLIDHDQPGKLRFASLQSDAARAVLQRTGYRFGEGDLESVLLVEGGRVYDRSTAVLRVARHLSSPFLRLAAALVVVPRPIRDAVYRWVARHRYAWFGKTQACRVPTPDLRARFLEP